MTLDTIQFHYSFRGNKDNPLILFLHGFMGDSQEFNQVLSVLSHQFCCLAVDLPGHGKTRVMGGDECYTMPNTAQSLINWLEQLNVKNCILVGYSMGGRLALYLALHFSLYFSKVVLESASPGLKTKGDRLERMNRDFELAQKLENTNFSLFVSNWYNQPLFASLKNYSDFELIKARRLQNNPLELAKSLKNLSTGFQPSLWDKLQQNTIPLLLLVGEYDEKFRAINSEMAQRCQSAQLEIIPDSGHNIHLENPKAWIDRVGLFLRNSSNKI